MYKHAKKEKDNRILIIVLAVLLAVVAVCLVIVLVKINNPSEEVMNVVVPDNIITDEMSVADDGSRSLVLSDEEQTVVSQADANAVAQAVSDNYGVIELYKFHASDNVPFAAVNMFPGDRETKNFGVSVSYKGKVTVRFRTDIKPGSEKLAEVLMCRIANPQTGEVLYDGLMKNVPELDVSLASVKDAVSVIPYEITAYLDTSVGNDYMYKSLNADFVWWVTEEGSLVPKTGDTVNIVLWVVIAAAAASAVVVAVVLVTRKRRKEDDDNGKSRK